MKKRKMIKLIFQNLLRNKLNFFLIILYVILGTVTIFGISYYSSVKRMWHDWQLKSYDFKLAYITYDENIDRNKLITEVSKNEHVKDIFLYDSFILGMKINDLNSNDYNGEVQVIGTIPGNKKILYGKDLSEKLYEIICPSSFFPDPIYVNKSYNNKKTIDLKDYVDKTLDINFVDNKVKLKLVGIFDSSYDYSDPNICYVNHQTIKYLNSMYQPDLLNEISPIYIQLDNIKNINEIFKIKGVDEIVIMKQIKFEVGNNIIKTCGFFVIFISILLMLLTYLIYNRRINNEYKNIGILMITGYSNKIIKKMYYIESIIIANISYFLSIIVAYIVTNNYVDLFLYDEPQLSLLKMYPTIISLLIACMIIFISIVIPTYKTMNKIDNLEVNSILYD